MTSSVDTGPAGSPTVDPLLASLARAAGASDTHPVKVTLLVGGRVVRGEIASAARWRLETQHDLGDGRAGDTDTGDADAGDADAGDADAGETDDTGPATPAFLHLRCTYAPGLGPTPPLRIQLSHVAAWAIGYAD